MKKIFMLMMTFALLLSSVCFAADAPKASSTNSQTAILLIGNNDFKSTQYFSMIEGQFIKNNPKASRIQFGSDVQTAYQEYWLDKGYLDEQTPTKDDLIAITKYIGTDKVLFLFVKDPVVEQHYAQDWFDSGMRSRASIQVNAFLVGQDGIIKLQTSNKEDDSFSSELRAKRGAFKKCMKEVSETMLPLM